MECAAQTQARHVVPINSNQRVLIARQPAITFIKSSLTLYCGQGHVTAVNHPAAGHLCGDLLPSSGQNREQNYCPEGK